MKRGDIPSADYQYIFASGAAGLAIGKSSDATLKDHLYVYNGSSLQEADPLIRDGGSWYHIVLSSNSGTGVLYLNGESIKTGISVASLSTSSGVTRVGRYGSGNLYFDGYLAETHLVTGSALTPSSFGETKNDIWIPKEYTGSHGDDGFKLTYSDSSDIGNDSSGENHDLTPSGFETNDVVNDSPTNNFSVMNPISGAGGSLNNGNLDVLTNAGSTRTNNIGMTSGKWYFEVTIGGNNFKLGLTNTPCSDTRMSTTASNTVFIFGDGTSTEEASPNSTKSTDSHNPNGVSDGIYSFALDVDNKICTVRRNNSIAYVFDTFTIDPPYFLGVDRVNSTAVTHSVNFGQLDFTYTPPSGFEKLNTSNLPDPAIDPNNDETPDQYFDTATYTANDGTLTITGLEFQPDLVWIKARSLDIAHAWFDVLRGTATAGSTNTAIGSNRTDSEGNGNGVLSAFTSDGFTVAGGSSGSNPRSLVNKGTNTYVAWTWKAGGSGVSNNDGTISSTVSANTEAGFSIVSYTGTGANATVGHGLSSAPEWIIVKNRTDASDWAVYHSGVGNTKIVRLNLNNAPVTASTVYFQNTDPSNSVITLGSSNVMNGSSDAIIAYCFHSVEGYSKFGTYTGNESSTAGAFVYTGFRPAWVMIKNISTTGNWVIHDNKRTPDNSFTTASGLSADLSSVESSDTTFRGDFLSTGFTVASGSNSYNNNGSTYIYMAFAKQPFKYANAR